MFALEGKQVHIKSWVPEQEFYEEGTLIQQTQNLAALPFAFHHIALMPDAHGGYGMPIGGVLATTGIVIPNAVGVDAGCGMLAIDLGKTVELFMEKRAEILHEITRSIPMGMNRKKNPEMVLAMDFYARTPYTGVIGSEQEVAAASLGTLGGGNHFIEFDKDERNHLWVVIHSGSRHLGQTLNRYYNKLAKDLNARYASVVPPSADLAFLSLDSSEGKGYMTDMNFCVEYAEENRRVMCRSILSILEKSGFPPVKEIPRISTRHNYAVMENHLGKNVLVHRKGAVRARAGELGVIPGSMGSCSYIAEGLGNPDSFESCSHGAGRPMSRTKAKELISVEEYTKEMQDKDILLVTNSKNVADESRGAYKPIEVVMENQKDLVTPVHTLYPLGVLKG